MSDPGHDAGDNTASSKSIRLSKGFRMKVMRFLHIAIRLEGST